MTEKLSIKKIWNIIYPVLLHYLFTFVMLEGIMTVIIVVAGRMGYIDGLSRSEVAEFIKQISIKNGLIINMGMAISFLPILIFLYRNDKVKRINKGTFRLFEDVNGLLYLLIIPAALFAMLAANYAVNVIITILPVDLMDSYKDTEELIYGGTSMTIQIIATSLTGPIVEELLFRGLVYSRMKEAMKYSTAIFLSSAIFGIYHGNFVQAPYAFVIGILCCLLYDRYRNILAPILFHMSANFFSVVLTLIAQNLKTTDQISQQTESVKNSISLYSMMIPIAVLTILTVLVFNIIYKYVDPKEIRQ